jgi:release factor glutamine methyltransferase
MSAQKACTLGALIADSQIDALEARMLAAFALDLDRAAIAAHPMRPVDAPAAARLQTLFARRRAGEPVAYLLGQREFWSRDFRLTPAVLIPRPETELLVETALQWLDGLSGGKAGVISAAAPAVLELGAGSGVVAITLALERGHCVLTAVDQSPDALAVARANAQRLGASVQFLHGDWFNPCVGQRYALVVSNPPYVATDDPHLQQGDLRYEPLAALDGGRGGFACLRRIAREVRRHLLPGGCLMLEHGYDQAARLRIYMRELGYVEVQSRDDLAGIARVTLGVMPVAQASTVTV